MDKSVFYLCCEIITFELSKEAIIMYASLINYSPKTGSLVIIKQIKSSIQHAQDWDATHIIFMFSKVISVVQIVELIQISMRKIT